VDLSRKPIAQCLHRGKRSSCIYDPERSARKVTDGHMLGTFVPLLLQGTTKTCVSQAEVENGTNPVNVVNRELRAPEDLAVSKTENERPSWNTYNRRLHFPRERDLERYFV